MLTEVGMVLAGAGRVTPAVDLFEALASLRPNRAFPYVGKAMALLNAGRNDEACQCLHRAQQLVTDELPTIDAFLGLSLQLAGRASESRAALLRAAQADPVHDGVGMARRMLGLESDPEGQAQLFSLQPSQGVE